MIGYTLPEIRRLLISLVQACAPDPRGVWSWSRWRRRRQYQARLCHYRQRGYALTYLSAVAVLSVTSRVHLGLSTSDRYPAATVALDAGGADTYTQRPSPDLSPARTLAPLGF
jgi:hypothetical protein